MVFYSQVYDFGDLLLYDVESRQTRRLTSFPSREAEPNFSPDGQWVVFESNRGSSYDIWAVRVDGGEVRQLTSSPAKEQMPLFSPDGRWVVFSLLENDQYQLYRLPW